MDRQPSASDSLAFEDRFLDAFRAAALQAGDVARHLRGKTRNFGKRHAGGPEASALTAVDLAAQDVILRRLLESIAEVAVDAEEETDLVARFPPPAAERPLVVLDPIDGTLNYSRGSADYAVMGALLVGGRYRASVVHLPERRATWWAIAGRGCFRATEDGPAERVRIHDQLPSIALAVPRFGRAAAEAFRPLGIEVRVSRCSAIEAAVVALGDALASVDPGTPDRRRAIGFLLACEAGGAVEIGGRAWTGEDPDLSERHGPTIVAPSGAIAERLRRALE